MRFSDICDQLKFSGIDDSKHEASLLLQKFCGVSPSALLSSSNVDFETPELLDAVKRRCEHYPLQYILGEWYFYGERYKVSEDCLIPRADTEILVEEAIRSLPSGAVFADLCTGSGCIAISILAHRADCSAIAIDISEAALALAKENADINGVSERFSPYRCDVLSDLSSLFNGKQLFDAIISNPPYIRTDVIDTLSNEVKNEPRIALDGGKDGLSFYRAILEKQDKILKKDGFIAFEIGFDQGDELRQLASMHCFDCKIIKDYGGCDRVAFLTSGIK